MSVVLIADDNVEFLELYTEVLAQMGHTALVAHNGVEALLVARRSCPDLLITDWNMPRMDGLALCEALRHGDDARLRALPIILHSAGRPSRRRVAEVGARFLAKPCSLTGLEQVITQALTGVCDSSEADQLQMTG